MLRNAVICLSVCANTSQVRVDGEMVIASPGGSQGYVFDLANGTVLMVPTPRDFAELQGYYEEWPAAWHEEKQRSGNATGPGRELSL